MSRRRANRPELSIVREGVPTVDRVGIASAVSLEPDEKVIINEVPAKVDGIVVGTAQIYDDGSVGIVLDENAPEEQLAKLRSEAGKFGYSIGDFIDGAS